MKIFEYGKDDVESLFESLQRRTPEGKRDVEEKVSEILRNVRERGVFAWQVMSEKKTMSLRSLS